MIYPRVIPVLLIMNHGLVKTFNFKNEIYIGDPINAVRIFNEKEVDELILLDIRATIENREPSYDLIKEIVSESFMPVGYGGGIKSLDMARKVFNTGVEKIIINTALNDIPFVSSLASIYGSQSIVGSVDVKKSMFGKYNAYTHSGRIKVSTDFSEYINKIVMAGAGEIILQSIDKEGTMKGYDLEIISKVTQLVNVPLVASGGAGDIIHFLDAINKSNASAVAAGSLFVFKGKQKGILINYPQRSLLQNLFNSIHNSRSY
jgi:cyclase